MSPDEFRLKSEFYRDKIRWVSTKMLLLSKLRRQRRLDRHPTYIDPTHLRRMMPLLSRNLIIVFQEFHHGSSAEATKLHTGPMFCFNTGVSQ